MKFPVFFVLLLSASSSSSQENDSVAKPIKKFESFFGCDCCQEADTVQEELTDQYKQLYTCTLYRSQGILKARMNGKVIWELDLTAYFQPEIWKECCLFTGGRDPKGRERLIVSSGTSPVVVLYLKNGKRVK
jgi:hypothetical protein